MVFISNSVDETEQLGRRIGKAVGERDGISFIAMYGTLGVGKTALVRGLASVLSPGSRVKSPTYTIVNEYRKGEKPLFHFDLYRIGDTDELDGFGFDEYVMSGNCIAEWCEKIGDKLPDGAISVKIERLGENGREITVSGLNLDGRGSDEDTCT